MMASVGMAGVREIRAAKALPQPVAQSITLPSGEPQPTFTETVWIGEKMRHQR